MAKRTDSTPVSGKKNSKNTEKKVLECLVEEIQQVDL